MTAGGDWLRATKETPAIRRAEKTHFARLKSALTGTESSTFYPMPAKEPTQAVWVPDYLPPRTDRNEVVRRLESRGIQTRCSSRELLRHPCFSRCAQAAKDIASSERWQTRTDHEDAFCGRVSWEDG
jgi:dTDP-4-amino-4,6-dideoxygalactose transaminase